MKTEIFAAEIRIQDKKNNNEGFLISELTNCIYTLKSTYDEVLLLSGQSRALVLAVGISGSFMKEVLTQNLSNATLQVSNSTDEAILHLVNIARGARWKNLALKNIREQLLKSVAQATDMQCLGSSLSSLMAFVINVNANQLKNLEHALGCENLLKPEQLRFPYSMLSKN